MATIIPNRLFPLGEVFITPAAISAVSNDEMRSALRRHNSGDWGELEEFDWKQNNEALDQGFRLLSSYRTSEGVAFWIITECDRSMTTILLPSDY